MWRFHYTWYGSASTFDVDGQRTYETALDMFLACRPGARQIWHERVA